MTLMEFGLDKMLIKKQCKLWIVIVMKRCVAVLIVFERRKKAVKLQCKELSIASVFPIIWQR